MGNKKNRKKARRKGDFTPIVSGSRSYAMPNQATLLRELGISGDTYEGGLVADPYNPALDGVAWFAKVDEMRRACGPVQAVESAITLPIADTDWSVDALSDEVGAFTEYAVKEAPSTTFSDVIRRAAMGAVYGTWAMEIIWKEEDGRLVPRRFADRLPRSISGYVKAPDGGLAGVKQEGTDSDGKAVEVEIPIVKLLLFPYRMEGDNWHGMSTIRTANRHYDRLNWLDQLSAIGAERGMTGVPYGKAPENATAEDKTTALTVLKNLRRHESSALVLPFGWEIAEIGTQSAKDLIELMEWHRGEIPRACLMDFIVIGGGDDGSMALVKSKLQLAMMAWNYWCGSIEDVLNRHLIPRLMLLNGFNLKPADMPKLRASRVGLAMLLAEMADFLATALTGKLIVPDTTGGDENFWRGMMGLPQRTDEELATTWGAAGGAPQAAPESAASPANGAPPAAPLQAMDVRPERAFAAVDVSVAVSRVAADMQAAEDEFQAAGAGHVADMLDALLTQVDEAADEASLVRTVRVPAELVGAYADWLTGWLDRAWDAAAARMEEETGTPVEPSADIALRHQVTAGNLAAHHAERARFEVVQAALRGDDLAQLASAFAAAMDIRLRGDLTTEARRVAGEVDPA